jgi:hypothetical protein
MVDSLLPGINRAPAVIDPMATELLTKA